MGRKNFKLRSSLTAVAYSTAEEYDLTSILNALKKQGLYKEKVISEDLDDVLYASAKYQVSEEPRELFIFREGSVVFWNFPEIERKAVLKFLKPHEEHSYSPSLVNQEVEALEFVYHENKTRFHDGNIYLSTDGESDLEKYTFSSGLALSVKLAIWEASLDSYVKSIEDIIEDMKQGRTIRMTREQVFRKTGELFSLRHLINLSSDLLDTPDFYWDRPTLESLYLKVIKYMNINRRTKVMNEKLTHCCELMDLLSHHLEDKHHVRLEVMIIVLIMVELGEVNDQMSQVQTSSGAAPSATVLHTLQRHRDILQDYVREFHKTRTNVQAHRERDLLLGSVRKDIE
ncbi:hypothetical protein HPB52_007769 [Rhipicephalus sanguineus]|uniref:DUF155 domain-containing protein n=1 Tax=Rhipicephalus sanguineus TaxID=34632 RepID=A0A9D4PV12_RHISA|nr:hypothetical protein HPB52_007769 [Rhipicephalus sanguineus]